MSSFTCKGCGSRFPGCHATCEKYLAEKKAWDEMMAEVRKRKAVQNGLDDHLINTTYKNKKRAGNQKPSHVGGQ